MRHIYLLAILLATLLATSCADDDRQGADVIPDGYGRLSFTIGTPDALATRSVSTTDTWFEGTTEERAIKSYVILICEGTTIVQKLSKNTETSLGDHDATNHYFPTSANIQSELMTLGNHELTIYCLANFTDAMLESVFGTGGLSAIGTTLPTGFEDKAIQISNCKTLPSTGMPMTGKLTATVNIQSGQTATKDTSSRDLVLILWRMLAKLQLDFVNESEQQMDILGIEIDPLNDGTVGIPLWQSANLSSADNDASGTIKTISGVKNGPWEIPTAPATALLVVPAKNGNTNGTATFYAYVNETDASYTAVQNQFSLRFKVKRGSTYDEYRYGVTTPYTDGSTGGNGFNVIRRNDWIHLPIHFTGWQFQIDALPFPPIAGFQARMLTADALSITFNTGGYIVLQPHFRKTTDTPGVWRGLDDSEITLTLPETESAYTGTSTKVAAIDGTTETGITMDGALGIFEQKFVRLPSGDIVGKLTNDPVFGTVTVTLTVKLESFFYQFQYNIIKQN